MNIKEKIRKLRIDNNLTQEEFANIINVSRSTVALYEKGVRTPDINIIESICNYFKIPISEFKNISKENNNKINKLKILILVFISILLLSSIIVSFHFININNTYGYNIYNDELRVKYSSDICIVKINNKISERDDEITYSIDNVDFLKKDRENVKIIMDKLNTKNNINFINTAIYLVFNNINNSKKNNKESFCCEINISSKLFMIELPNYDESLSYNNQTGESKKIIDYYLNIINKNK